MIYKLVSWDIMATKLPATEFYFTLFLGCRGGKTLRTEPMAPADNKPVLQEGTSYEF